MSNELMKREDMDYYALHFARSGYFGKIKAGDEMALGVATSQAVVKIKAGEEIGVGAFASMNGFYISQNGTMSMMANLMAAKVKGSQKYDYFVTPEKHTNEMCEIIFYEGEKIIGVSVYTLEDAKQAGLLNKANWKQTPRNMVFSRAMSNGVRWYCPDVFGGATVYTPEELEDIPEQEPAFVVQPAPELPANVDANVVKTKYLKALVAHKNYPADESPLDRVNWVNDQIKEKELNIEEVKIGDLAAIE